MSYKKFVKVIFLIIIILFMNTVNASDVNENVTSIETSENDYDGLTITTVDYLNQNYQTTNSNSNEYSLIICDENYTIIEGFNSNFSSNLSSYYFNNNIYSHIENQSNSNNCWAFAAISTLESNILKINQSLIYDFSENNMKNIMSSSSNYGLSSISVNGGGYDRMAIGYLTSWLGPVLESDDPYNLNSINTNLFNSNIHVQNVLFNVHNNTNIIKKAIFNYGAVSLSYIHNKLYYNETFKSFYSPTNSSGIGHSISIIGWDDNFPKEHFNNVAPQNGAFICKNSDGENFGNNGLFYMSYYEYYLKNQRNLGTYTFILNDTTNYNRNYQYDIAPLYQLSNSNNIWFKNNYVSEGNDLLTAVATYFEDVNINYSIEIFVNNESKLNQSGVIENMGYYTILLNNQIPLNIGDNFTVAIKLSKNYNFVKFKICPDIQLTSVHHPNHVSFFSYNGNNWYDLTTYSVNSTRGVACIKAFTVHNPLDTCLDLIVADEVDVFDDIVISARVCDLFNNSVLKGSVTFVVDGEEFVVSVVDGYANLTTRIKNAGNISIHAYFSDYDYKSSQCSKNIFVNKSDLNLSCHYSYDELFNCTIIEVLASEYFNSTVFLFTDNNNYSLCVVEGIGFIQLHGYLNLTSSFVEFNGNNNFNPCNATITYKNHIVHEIYNTYDVELYYKNGTRFTIALRNNGVPVAGKQVTVCINGASYTRTTKNDGSASIALNLHSGVYNITTSYLDENNQTVIIDNIITIYTTIISQDLVKVYRNASQFKATFLDDQGNPLQNASVTFNINGVMYNRMTNENGTAKLNINLDPGKYVITSINPVNGEMASNNVTVISRIIGNHDLVKYYRNGSQYIVQILDDMANPVGAGESVTFNINGVFYTRQTNSSGHVKLNINLLPGEYIITVMYYGCRVSNYIKVLSVLSASDVVMKYRDGTQFVAKLVDNHGNPYANQTISFNINGVFYNRTTNADGEAKLNINLSTGEYIITSSYNGCNIANTITII